MTIRLAASARDYVQGLDLPMSAPVARDVPKVAFSDRREAVAVGSDLAEFSEAVAPDLRGVIADSMLLAQLAANKAAGESRDVMDWYEKYLEVLQNIGWQVRDLEFQTQTVTSQHAGLHQAIIPVITAMLGPQVAAASIVIAVLNGLKEMDATTPWMTVFEKSSRHAHGAKFQVSHVDVNALGEPEVALVCFGVRARQTITQVLFFKFTAQDAEVKKAGGKLAIAMDRLSSAKEAIAGRVRPFVADYVMNVDI